VQTKEASYCLYQTFFIATNISTSSSSSSSLPPLIKMKKSKKKKVRMEDGRNENG
jgi:hypothetical protein